MPDRAGAALAGVLMLVTYVTGRAKNFPTMPRASARRGLGVLQGGVLGLDAGGDRHGGESTAVIFTPTEAAAVARSTLSLRRLHYRD